MGMALRGFYFITDRVLSSKPDAEAVRDAVEGGCCVVQYREKRLPTRDMIETSFKLKEIVSEKAYFLINDRVDVALAVNADGVHLGQEDMPLKHARRILCGRIIGVTVHNIAEALSAEKSGADYLGVSPIFKTTTKDDAGKPVGLEMIREIKAAVDLPLAAIGGINEFNVDSVIEAGADMVCAISATVARKDVKAAVESFSRRFRG